MDIVYRKTGFKREFSRFLMYKYKQSSDLFRKKTINTYLKANNSLHKAQISSFKYVFIVFFETNQILEYTFIISFLTNLKKRNVYCHI